ncbi:MAG: crotonase/enoyl-CoA hydratase family protein [Acidobacteriota bacterium]|nr:crotonase/enoyl-CoA hydratase family protein [Blastocatellia bacterium]MDW8412014.1 crotonase/enoyl-CoA hydratase family protein [Acidobacteriota bacterium]
MSVRVSREGVITIITLDRPQVRNAIDAPTAAALLAAFTEFEADKDARVGILYGAGGTFCSGADLKALASGKDVPVLTELHGPLGPSRMLLSKPLIAAVAGYAVAGGLELALLADIRVAERSAVFGVFNRRWGIPLIDGGTVRLPRIIGLARALDMVLTGRKVSSDEALAMGLVNYVVDDGQALTASLELARRISSFPQPALLVDRRNCYGSSEELHVALRREFEQAVGVLKEPSVRELAIKFADGEGRHGEPLCLD